MQATGQSTGKEHRLRLSNQEITRLARALGTQLHPLLKGRKADSWYDRNPDLDDGLRLLRKLGNALQGVGSGRTREWWWSDVQTQKQLRKYLVEIGAETAESSTSKKKKTRKRSR
ncbi:MAG: hypothetical protein ACE5JI_04575 [Acidobacteriota bacterium]